MARRSTPNQLTIASDVYERLRADILRGILAPGGKLRIEQVCERYGAGNSPVREALNRLSTEGLVERREQRGFYVVAISAADLDDLVCTRCLLEEAALRQAMARQDAAWHEGLVVALHRLTRVPRFEPGDAYRENPEWEQAHREFHRALVAGCGSGRLVRLCLELHDQAYRYRQLAIQDAFPRHRPDEHSAIVECILAGDGDGAAAALTAHYHRTADLCRRLPGMQESSAG